MKIDRKKERSIGTEKYTKKRNKERRTYLIWICPIPLYAKPTLIPFDENFFEGEYAGSWNVSASRLQISNLLWKLNLVREKAIIEEAIEEEREGERERKKNKKKISK